MMKLLYYGILIFLGLWVVSLYNPKQVLAFPEIEGPVVFEEDFSNGNLNKWEDVRNDPDGYWEVIDGWALATISDGSTLAELVPKDEYWDNDWHDIVYELDYFPMEGVDRNISFNFIDINNWYEIHFVGSGYEMARLKDGYVVWTASGTAPVPSYFSNKISFVVDGPRIQIYINGIKYVDEIDQTFDGSYGKIGLKAGSGSVAPTTVKFDNIKVSLLRASKPVGIVTDVFKQNDPVWASEEYDNAESWAISDASDIERWGCALTSLAMIMNYHHISTMPNNLAVNPSTLNEWLKSQPDGFVGEGLLNWIAATRLIREISDAQQTTKLEYGRVNNPDNQLDISEQLMPASERIGVGQPVILQIPGHFMVGDGVEMENYLPKDLLIKDPLYDYQKLSEHESDLLSTRTFSPTQTDLSYLLIVVKEGVVLRIFDPEDKEVASNFLGEEYVKSSEGSLGNRFQLLEIPKPKIGDYKLVIGSDKNSLTNIQIFAYDQKGSFTDLSTNLVLGDQPKEIKIDYNYLSSTISFEYSFEQLVSDIRTFNELGHFYKHYAFRRLIKFAELGKVSNIKLKSVYKKIFRYNLGWFQDKISPEAHDYLLFVLSQIST